MKKLKLIDLFSILDDNMRLVTDIHNVQETLSFIAGRAVYTHEIPDVLLFIKQLQPAWYRQAKNDSDAIVALCGNKIDAIVYALNEMSKSEYEVQQLSEEQQIAFIRTLTPFF